MLQGVGLFTLAMLARIWQAFVLVHVWRWYVTPFFSVRELPLAYAFGLVMFAYCITPYYGVASDTATQEKQTASDRATTVIAICLAIPAVTLGMAWIGTFFL